MIKFKNHSKGNNIEYIKCSNIILPIKSIVYIEKNISRTYDSVRPNVYYTIYFASELKYEVNNPFGSNTREYKLRYKKISISENTFNKTLKPLLADKVINIERL